VAALLPVYLLWDAEADHIKREPTEKNTYLAFFGCLAFTLWADAKLLIYSPMKRWIDETINDICIRQVYADQTLLVSKLHKQEIDRFYDLGKYFRVLDDEGITTVSSQLSFSDAYTQQLAIENGNLAAEYAKMSYWQRLKGVFSDQDTQTIKTIKANIEQIKINEALRLLKVLQQIHKECAIGGVPIPEAIEAWRTDTAKVLGVGLPLVESVARSAVFWYLIDDILGSLGLPYGALRSVLSIGCGELIASGFQGIIEVDSVKKALADLLFASEEGDNGRNPAWKTLRKIAKGGSYLLGGVYAIPDILLGRKALQWWPSGAKWFNLGLLGTIATTHNAMCLQESAETGIYAVETVAALYGKVTPGYRRNKTVNTITKLGNCYNSANPDVLKDLNTMVLSNIKYIED
jgi:hypothetical protein